jgi:hypothetical protein
MFLLYDHLFVVVAYMLGAFLIGTVFLTGEPAYPNYDNSKSNSSDLSPIIHIILDEHASIGSLERANDDAMQVADRIKKTLIGRSFELHGNVFSQYTRTWNALPNLFNFDNSAKDNSYFIKPEIRDLYENKLFKRVSDKGYQINVFQSDFLNYCADRELVSRCYTYNSTSTKYLHDQALPYYKKSIIIFANTTYKSNIINTLRRKYFQYAYQANDPDHEFGWPGVKNMVAVASYSAAQDYQDYLRTHNLEGQYVLLHLLLPHYTYTYKNDCTLEHDLSHWYGTRHEFVEPPAVNSEQSRSRRYLQYAKQVGCTWNIVEKILVSLEAYPDATIVIHGDHGSRLFKYVPSVENTELLTKSDYEDGYFTLFAVKSPNGKSGYVDNKMSLLGALGDVFAESGLQDIDYVYLEQSDSDELIPHKLSSME